jgi:UDP-3-O-[3-hydroxymyristoyl] glucosamine N-acyltransferase
VIDPRFYDLTGPVAAADLAAATGAVVTRGDPAALLSAIAPLDEAGPGDLAFCEAVPKTGAILTLAGACLVPPGAGAALPEGVAALEVRAPKSVLGAAASRLVRQRELEPDQSAVHPLAWLEAGVTVLPGAVIGAGAQIGTGTVIGAGATIGPGVCIGRHCRIGNGVRIECALIGDRVRIGSNSVVGEPGFGVTGLPENPVDVPQLGRVVIQDDVTLGALVAVDRAAFGETVVGLASKIDNFVHVGHNVRLGRGVVIAAFGGISGSTDVGDFVLMGGRVGIGDHHTIGERAILAAGSAVLSDVPAREMWQGYPAQPAMRWRREQVAVRRLTDTKKKT